MVAWPLIITNILNVAVGLVDLKMVGSLGLASIAAVGISRQVMNLLMVLMLAISGGSSVLIAREHGAGNLEKVGIIASRSIVFMLMAAIFIVSPMGYFFCKPFLLLLGGAPDVAALGQDYLRILFAGSIFTMFNFAVSGVLLGIGKTKVSLVLLIGVNALNILFNYLLIFGVGPLPELGIRGAALGTVIARGLGMLAGIWITLSKRFLIQAKYRRGFQFDRQLLSKIIHLGGPRSLQGIVRNFSRLMTIRIITLLPDSTRAVSAYSVAMQVRMISSFVGLAFMSAAMTRVSQNIGAGKIDTAEKSGWIAAIIAALFMTVFAVFFFLFPELIMGFFTKDKEAIALGKSFFMIVALTEPFMALAFALGGALRGGGDPIPPFIYSSISDLIVVIAISYLLAVVFQLGFSGIALGIAISVLTRAIPTMLRYQQGKWKTKKI